MVALLLAWMTVPNASEPPSFTLRYSTIAFLPHIMDFEGFRTPTCQYKYDRRRTIGLLVAPLNH